LLEHHRQTTRVVPVGVRADDKVHPVRPEPVPDVLHDPLAGLDSTAIDDDEEPLVARAMQVAEADDDRIAASLAIADGEDIDLVTHLTKTSVKNLRPGSRSTRCR